MNAIQGTAITRLGRRLAVVLACTALVACHSFEPITGTPAELRGQLRAGQLVKVGDQLRVHTTAGKSYRLTVVAIDQRTLRAGKSEISIDDITALERAHFSTGKTLLLVGGVTLIAVGAIASSASMGPSSMSWGSAAAGG
jgi:hypothetical protein